MTDKEQLIESINHSQEFFLMELAAVAEEEGDLERAEGYRWLLANKKWPLRVCVRKPNWHGWFFEYIRGVSNPGYELPQMGDKNRQMSYQDTCTQALELAALEMGRIILKAKSATVSIGIDGRCQCSMEKKCPLGKGGLENRCTREELEKWGVTCVKAPVEKPNE